jgi:hypothetical protein
MGASLVYLNEPNKEIEHEKGGNEYLAFAAGSMQGWRLNMVSDNPKISNLLGFMSIKNRISYFFQILGGRTYRLTCIIR